MANYLYMQVTILLIILLIKKLTNLLYYFCHVKVNFPSQNLSKCEDTNFGPTNSYFYPPFLFLPRNLELNTIYQTTTH